MGKTKAKLDIKADPPILVNSDRCDLCGACIGICPPDCLSLTEHALKVDGPKCIKCGICIPVCPVAALKWNDDEDREVELND